MERATGALTSILRVKSTKYTIAVLVGLFVLRKLREIRLTKRIKSSAAARIAVVRKERDDAVEWARKESELVDPEERRKIASMDFRTLQRALQSGTVTAEAVMRTYFGLAVKAHDKTNCLTGVIRDALEQAQKMDEEAKNPAYNKTALWGIPLSVKESNMIKGHRCTWGLVANIDSIPSEDSYPVAKLRSQGMIPFVQTNVPTTLLTYMTENSLFGTTSNPHDSSRTCGGSSGGEGALIGSLGSIIGLGSDIGGSIRIPSAYSGCCGFKPSATRFSSLMLHEPVPFRPVCTPTEGPLAQDPHAIVEIMRSVWSDLFFSNQDPLAVPVDFREDLFKEGTVYRIGYYTSDGFIDPLPGNQRVIREAVELLRSKGHELVPFSLREITAEMARGVFGTVFADGGVHMTETLKHEPLSPLMEPLRAFAKMSLWVKTALGWMSKLRGDKPTAEFFLSQSDRAIDVQAGINRAYASRKRLVQKMKDERIDIILCPSTISPAMPHAMPNEIPFTAITATMMWNAMDFPAGVVTTSKWTEQDEQDMEAYPEKGLVESEIKKGCKGSVGLPLSVQLVAPAFRDESVLRVMVDLYDSMKEARTAQ